MKNILSSLFLFLITFILIPIKTNAATSNSEIPVVHAVLFYSPTCGHCHLVITEVFPPLIEKFGDQLQIIGINIATSEGQNLYQEWLQAWNVPDEKRGVPTLLVGDLYLFGSGEIPEKFPDIVEEGMHTGGIGWPDIPGFEEVLGLVETPPDNQDNETQATIETTQLPQDEMTPGVTENQINNPINTLQATKTNQNQTTLGTPEVTSEISSSVTLAYDQEITFIDRFRQDLAGNIISIIVLIGMIISVIWVIVRILSTISSKKTDWSWTIPILSILGIFIAGYLSFIEVTETEAVCGPIGHCNDVQQSPYAILFGILPVGVLGLIGYLGILMAWLINKYGPEEWSNTLYLGIWGMALFGVIFSIYLTYLEPFVIGATCMWCISSAVIITLQLLAATEPVRSIWAETDDDIEED